MAPRVAMSVLVCLPAGGSRKGGLEEVGEGECGGGGPEHPATNSVFKAWRRRQAETERHLQGDVRSSKHLQ